MIEAAFVVCLYERTEFRIRWIAVDGTQNLCPIIPRCVLKMIFNSSDNVEQQKIY